MIEQELIQQLQALSRSYEEQFNELSNEFVTLSRRFNDLQQSILTAPSSAGTNNAQSRDLRKRALRAAISEKQQVLRMRKRETEVSRCVECNNCMLQEHVELESSTSKISGTCLITHSPISLTGIVSCVKLEPVE